MCPHATHVSHSLSLHHTQTPFTMAAVDARNGKPWAVIECPHRCSTECPHQQPHMVGPLCSTHSPAAYLLAGRTRRTIHQD